MRKVFNVDYNSNDDECNLHKIMTKMNDKGANKVIISPKQ